jgi:hypothetical protein
VQTENYQPGPGSRVSAEGPEVVALGVIVIASSGYTSVRLLARKSARFAEKCIGVGGLLIVAVGMVFAAYRVVVVYSGLSNG